MFPFALRARILIPSQERLRHSKSHLHFVLLARDVSAVTRAKILRDFAAYPVVQHYTSADLDRFFGLSGAKVLGFAKSRLAQSIYAELKTHRLNKPPPGQFAPRATATAAPAGATGPTAAASSRPAQARRSPRRWP